MENLLNLLWNYIPFWVKWGEDMNIGISSDNYINSLFLLPFDVTPTSVANMEYLSKKQGGNCHIELQFHKPLPHNNNNNNNNNNHLCYIHYRIEN